jgi:Flp pilus assembly protein TadD
MRKVPLAFVAILLLLSSAALAQELRISIPKRSKATPVQQLNRDGVKAVEAHNYDKAKKLFYKAYLLDPNDPFTLNNLGYMAELDGDLDRAQRYYGLAADLSSDAVVDKATNDVVEGKPVAEVAGNAQDRNMQVNRLNIEAMSLLNKDRAPEADLVLQKALKVDGKNAFTLNNMGFAKEKEGELQQALSYYTAAAATRSQERVVVSSNSDWRGKPIAEIADRNAKKVRKDLQELNGNVDRQVALLNLRGVSALNRNDPEEARKLFEQAYKLDPQNAFAVNNMGYIAELSGDRETAEFYYAKAREAEHADSTVRLATRKEAEGQKLGAVALESDNKVQSSMAATVEARRASGQPVELRRRDNSIVQPLELPAEDTTPVAPPASNAQPGAVVPPLPDNQQPPAAQPNPSGVIPPLPDNQQPPAVQPGAPGVIPPLPDNQQPPAAQPGNSGVIPPLPENQQPPAAQTPPSQPGASKVIPPLPDDQQPSEARGQSQPPAQQQSQPGAAKVIPPLPDDQQPPAAKNQSPPPSNQRPLPPGQQPSSQRPPQ